MSPYIHMPTLKNPPLHSSTIWKYKKTKQSKQKQNKYWPDTERLRKFFSYQKKNPGKRNGQFEFWRENSKPSNDDNAQNSDFKFLCQFVFSLQYSIICRQNSLLSSSKKQEENLMMYNIVIANYHLLIITLLLSPYYNY